MPWASIDESGVEPRASDSQYCIGGALFLLQQASPSAFFLEISMISLFHHKSNSVVKLIHKDRIKQ